MRHHVALQTSPTISFEAPYQSHVHLGCSSHVRDFMWYMSSWRHLVHRSYVSYSMHHFPLISCRDVVFIDAMACPQDHVFGPMIAAPPQQWPVEQGDESARLLTWLSADGGDVATLEGAIVMVLRFVAGASMAPELQNPKPRGPCTHDCQRGFLMWRTKLPETCMTGVLEPMLRLWLVAAT